MLKQRKMAWLGLICFPLTLWNLSGCTVIGMGVGHSVDVQGRPLPETTPEVVAAIPEGTKVSAQLVDGKEIKGKVLFYSQADSVLVIQPAARNSNSTSPQLNFLLEEELEPENEAPVRVKVDELIILNVPGTGKKGMIIGTFLGLAADVAVVAVAFSTGGWGNASPSYSMDWNWGIGY